MVTDQAVIMQAIIQAAVEAKKSVVQARAATTSETEKFK